MGSPLSKFKNSNPKKKFIKINNSGELGNELLKRLIVPRVFCELVPILYDHPIPYIKNTTYNRVTRHLCDNKDANRLYLFLVNHYINTCGCLQIEQINNEFLSGITYLMLDHWAINDSTIKDKPEIVCDATFLDMYSMYKITRGALIFDYQEEVSRMRNILKLRNYKTFAWAIMNGFYPTTVFEIYRYMVITTLQYFRLSQLLKIHIDMAKLRQESGDCDSYVREILFLIIMNFEQLDLLFNSEHFNAFEAMTSTLEDRSEKNMNFLKGMYLILRYMFVDRIVDVILK